MKLQIKYWVNGHDEYTHDLEIKQEYTAWIELPRILTPGIKEHHITISEVKA